MAESCPPNYRLEINPYHAGYDQSDNISQSGSLKSYHGSTGTGSLPRVKQPPVVDGIPPTRDYMMWSILACIFCFMPAGVVAVYHAYKAQEFFEAGCLLEAEHAQQRSRKFIIISFIIGTVILIVTSIVIGVLFSSNA